MRQFTCSKSENSEAIEGISNVGLVAIVGKGLGVRGDSALDKSVIPVLRRGHLGPVDIPSSERKPAVSMRLDRVLFLSDMLAPYVR